MSSVVNPLASAARIAYGLGLAICFGTPGVIAMLLLSGAIAPGTQMPEGLVQQVGYLFTGLVFLAAAWVWWRRGGLLRSFKQLPTDRQPAMVIRETILYAAAFEASSLCGLVYWTLVGAHAARHVWGFVLLTPILFLALVPRPDHWARALEA